MSPLGIYFGSKTITVSEVKGRKLTNNIFITPPAASSSELQDASDAEIKSIEIIALFKSELRRSKISATEAVLCLPGKDLIIRTFDMPVMPKNELNEAVFFEAKKYIPFKIDELISAFQVEFNKSTKTNSVLFVGIKKEVLDRYFALLSQLNIKITAVEYSAFSVLRSFKLAGINDNGIVGILEADLNNDEEINFTILENGLPLFTRDFNLAIDSEIGAEEVAGAVADKGAAALEKLKTELRVSLDYYHRKYPTKTIQKIYFNCNPECRTDLENFMSESGLNAHAVDLVRITGKQVPFTSGLVRSYSASLFNAVNSKVKVNVLAAKTRQKVAKEKTASPELASLLEGIKIDYRVIALGVLICGGVYGYGFYKVQLAQQELENAIKLRPVLSSISPSASYDELNNKKTTYKNKLDSLQNLIKVHLGVTVPLDVIPKSVPSGLWLTELSYNRDQQDRSDLSLKGTVFLADSDKEFEAVNAFITKLRESTGFSQYFKNVKLESFDRVKDQDITVAKFYISCKTN